MLTLVILLFIMLFVGVIVVLLATIIFIIKRKITKQRIAVKNQKSEEEAEDIEAKIDI